MLAQHEQDGYGAVERMVDGTGPETPSQPRADRPSRRVAFLVGAVTVAVVGAVALASASHGSTRAGLALNGVSDGANPSTGPKDLDLGRMDFPPITEFDDTKVLHQHQEQSSSSQQTQQQTATQSPQTQSQQTQQQQTQSQQTQSSQTQQQQTQSSQTQQQQTQSSQTQQQQTQSSQTQSSQTQQHTATQPQTQQQQTQSSQQPEKEQEQVEEESGATETISHGGNVNKKNSEHEAAMEALHEAKEGHFESWHVPQDSTVESVSHPHIIKVLIDDMGHNDMGYNNRNGDVWTPTMDSLAGEGIILHRYYTQFTCTPSRAAFMTAKLPIHTGLQHGQIFYNQPWGLPLHENIMPQYLNTLGYKSHIVGKWHLGHYNDASLPTNRGFETFFGMLDGAQFYSTHVDAMRCNLPGSLLYNGNEDYTEAFDTITSKGCYFDFYTNNASEAAYFGQYNTFLFRDRAMEKVYEHAANFASSPLFLYLAFNAVHSPVSSPHSVFTQYPEIKSIKFEERKRFSAALRLVDDAVADLVESLKRTGMYENSLLLVSSDNGANPENGGSNSPLRGSKGYLFEGGVRCPAFIHGPGVIPASAKGSVYYGMFHISDWLPTLVEGVLDKPELLAGQELDGMNIWPALVDGAEPPRNEMLLNIDYLDGSLAYGSQPLGYDTAALVHGPWKLIVNSGELQWYETPDSADGIIKLYASDEVVSPHTYLFNVLDDPEERTDVSDQYPHIVDKLLKRIADYRATMITCEWRGDDDKSLGAIRADGFIGPWYKADETPPKSSNCQDGFDVEHKDARWIKSQFE